MFGRILLILSTLFALSACDQQIVKSPYDNKPRIVLNDSNIVLWSVTQDGIGVKLSDQGTAELKTLTEANIKKPIDIYVGNMLIFSPVVSEPITNGQLLLYTDNDKVKFDKMIDSLPAGKRQ